MTKTGPDLWVLRPDSAAAYDTTKTLEIQQFFSSPDATPILIVVTVMILGFFLFRSKQ